MKRLIIIISAVLVLALGITATYVLTSKSNQEQGEEQGQEQDQASDQLSLPQKGETVAEIIIKDFGSIHVKFFEKEAPKAVENFITHARDGYYDGLTFHRVIKDFMIQGGDPEGIGSGGKSIWGTAFEDEFADNLQPLRGALCMANSGPSTNGSQFFIVQTAGKYDAATLTDFATKSGFSFSEDALTKYANIGGTPWLFKAHTVFGQAYEGEEILDAVVQTSVDEMAKPLEDVIIEKIVISEYDK